MNEGGVLLPFPGSHYRAPGEPSQGRVVRPQKDLSECREHRGSPDPAGKGLRTDSQLGFLKMNRR